VAVLLTYGESYLIVVGTNSSYKFGWSTGDNVEETRALDLIFF